MENGLKECAAHEHNGKMVRDMEGGKGPGTHSSPGNASWKNNNPMELNGGDSIAKVKQHMLEVKHQQRSWKHSQKSAIVELVGVAVNCNQPLPTNSCKTREGRVEDEGGGMIAGMTITEEGQISQNGASTTPNTLIDCIHLPSQSLLLPGAGNETMLDYDGALAGAASLTPPDNTTHSNRTSMNNSTENLSYASDNYYADDLILVDEVDDDIEAEEISMNSDDCVYAYRGDGLGYTVALDTYAGRAGCDVGGTLDDETDFLEMDFEPDPLSELDYGFMELPVQPEADALLLQRDSLSHISGRHSAALHTSPTMQRQLFSSPIDDVPLTSKVLQTQAQLSKNFARISLHLDQIKGDAGECRYEARTSSTRNDYLNPLVDLPNDCVDVGTAVDTVATAHSLPSTFVARTTTAHLEAQASPTKFTGAKPKRLSTFSASSSTSSKNSCKSRSSLRSAYVPAALGASASFDERSASCTEFRSSVSATAVALPAIIGTETSFVTGCSDFYAQDDACLDCLEREFLANTIGKALEPLYCARCRRRCGMVNARPFLGRSVEGVRCRSGSPSSFYLEVRDDCLYGADDFLPSTLRYEQRDSWLSASAATVKGSDSNRRRDGLSKVQAAQDLRVLNWNERCEGGVSSGGGGGSMGPESLVLNQSRSKCDNFKGERLMKDYLLTETEIVTISTVNLTEEVLVQALDKLHITYNLEVLQKFFRSLQQSNSHTVSTTMCKPSVREFNSMRHLLLHESKKMGNHMKLKRLIDLATRQQVNIQFKQDRSIAHTELVPVSVAQILQQWSRTSNLASLKQLDKRFVTANVLGKVANIIRQAEQQQRASSSSSSSNTLGQLPECISIPQYYASGFLTLSKQM